MHGITSVHTFVEVMGHCVCFGFFSPLPWSSANLHLHTIPSHSDPFRLFLTLSSRSSPLLFPDNILTPFPAHPDFMAPSGIDINPPAGAESFFLNVCIVGVGDRECAGEDEVRC